MLVLICLVQVVYKHVFESKWLLVFHHNSKNKEYFANREMVLDCDQTNLYSILGKIDDSYRINGSFEFLLEYPEFDGYNRWSQINNPVNENETIGKNPVSGYRAINISWNARFWGGLAISTQKDHTFIDGSIGSGNYYYMIGAYHFWYISHGGIDEYHFAGPDVAVSECFLWLRINESKGTLPGQRKSVFSILLFTVSIFIINNIY